MSKLEIKHLAPYLPYGLKVKTTNKMSKDKIHTPKFIDAELEMIYLKEIPFKINQPLRECHLPYIKPILRPLSELTKEIGKEHLFKLLGMQYMNIKDINKCKVENDGIYYGDVRLSYLNYEQPEGIQLLRYPAIQYLFEHHFDVFGLIEKGLAIDKNTIE